MKQQSHHRSTPIINSFQYQNEIKKIYSGQINLIISITLAFTAIVLLTISEAYEVKNGMLSYF